MLEKMLGQRAIPSLLLKEEMLDIILREEYGYMPPKPDSIKWQVRERIIRDFCAGKARVNQVTAICKMGKKEFAFPFYTCIPSGEGTYPFFIHINLSDSIQDRYMPTEELVDNGYAVLTFGYEDVSKDNNDLTDGLAGILYPDGKRGPSDAGKIAMWAWAAQRVMDYAETRSDVLDLKRSIVCGHSRLGKTALLAGATDERFQMVYSNNSGCSGAAITRAKYGERVDVICRVFPYWFCENYAKYKNAEETMPFDQHYLVASIAPRKVLVGSASEDFWADPISELLGCVAAGPAFGGFICEDKLPEIGDKYFESDIGYHMRKGRHYFSREDWQRLIEFANKKFADL